MSVFVSAGIPANLKRNEKTESWKRKEVLHLFRSFTHRPCCRGAFLEDAELETDQIGQKTSKSQVTVV
jgi:hypothetical protein